MRQSFGKASGHVPSKHFLRWSLVQQQLFVKPVRIGLEERSDLLKSMGLTSIRK